MKKVCAVIAAVIVLASASVAQECNIQTVSGTYMFRGVGQSFIGGPLSASNVPLHSLGAYFGGTHVGVITVHPDYTVDTVNWIAMGPYRMGIDAAGVRAPARITSIGVEYASTGEALGCAATIQYPSPFGPDVVDKFVIFDGGNEMRGVHFSNENPITTSIFVAKRLTRSLDPAPRCGPNTLKGSYVATCSAAPFYTPTQTLSTANMFFLKTLGEGKLTGTMFNRIYNRAAAIPVSGEISMSPDCTGDGYMTIPGLLPAGAKMLYKLMTYDEGKAGFLMPLQIEMSDGSRVDYFSSMSCQLERTAP